MGCVLMLGYAMCDSWTRSNERLELRTGTDVAQLGDWMVMDGWHGTCPGSSAASSGSSPTSTQLHLLHRASLIDRSCYLCQWNLTLLARRQAWDDQGGPPRKRPRGGVRWMCVWMCVWGQKGREELGGVGGLYWTDCMLMCTHVFISCGDLLVWT